MSEEKLQALEEGRLSEVSGGGYNGPVFVYKIQSGDTLQSIAGHYKTTEAILAELNNIGNPLNPLPVGQLIMVPSIW